MSRILKIRIYAIALMLIASLSFAQNHETEIIIAKAPSAYSYRSVQTPVAKSKRTVPYALNHDKLSGNHFSLYRESEDRGEPALMGSSSPSYAIDRDIYNIPQSMVNVISYDFSHNGIQRSLKYSMFELPSDVGDVLLMGAAFLTNLAAHEFGHEVVAQNVDAEGSRLNFFHKKGNDFFLGTSSVSKIDKRSKLSYTLGGEFFADLTFEHALKGYRKDPNTFNKSLLAASGTDFLWYCFYSFYLAEDNSSYDPITISKETGISRDMLFAVVLAKTLLNAHRIYSGYDTIVPYFKVDRHSASLHVMVPFDIGI